MISALIKRYFHKIYLFSFFLFPALSMPILGADVGEVVSVSDGDSLEVTRAGRILYVNLAEVDAPEIGEPLGREAREFTEKMVLGKTIVLDIEGIDDQGGIMARVILLNGKSLNRALLRSGLAVWDEDFSEDQSLGKLEEAAMKKEIGLWKKKPPPPVHANKNKKNRPRSR